MTNSRGRVDTSDEWIVQRTGIRERHIAADGEFTSDLGHQGGAGGARRCRHDAAGYRPDRAARPRRRTTPFPATAVSIQAGLGITTAASPSTCRRCVRASSTGSRPSTALLRGGMAKRALLIGAETFSRILDWTDRTTCVLFGDGAGAVVIEAQEQPGAMTDRGILTTHLRSDGRHKMKLYVDGGPSSTQTVGHLRMEGREVFKHAVTMITDVIEDAFAATGYTARDLDWFVPHQANSRIIDGSVHQARARSGQGHHHRRQARQYLGRLDSARALRRHCRRAHQEGRSRDVRGDGWRLHLGRLAGAHVGMLTASRARPSFTASNAPKRMQEIPCGCTPFFG